MAVRPLATLQWFEPKWITSCTTCNHAEDLKMHRTMYRAKEKAKQMSGAMGAARLAARGTRNEKECKEVSRDCEVSGSVEITIPGQHQFLKFSCKHVNPSKIVFHHCVLIFRHPVVFTVSGQVPGLFEPD